MKSFELEDPFTLVGVGLAEDPSDEALTDMAWAVVEEYIRLGWTEQRLMTLFVNPTFLATHRIYRLKGKEYVHELIRKTCAKWGFTAERETLPPSVGPAARWSAGR